MASERGPQGDAYDEFKKDVQRQVRDIKRYLRTGEELSQEEIISIFDLLFINLAHDLDDIDPVTTVKWLNKAEKYLQSTEARLLQDEEFADVIEEASQSSSAEISISEGFITLNGIEYAIVDSGIIENFKRRDIKRRGRTITSLAELEEYVDGIPAVQGIEFVYDANGVITGYRVWISDKS
jgi:hypothetical protein